ncbi:bleomycin hydrolase [Nowakowskiella sp. JEL0407]|nr:bleomycin hydrolase [Nowakowskiella sp. JEL0407]
MKTSKTKALWLELMLRLSFRSFNPNLVRATRSYSSNADALIIGVNKLRNGVSKLDEDCLSNYSKSVLPSSVKSRIFSQISASQFTGTLGDVRLIFDGDNSDKIAPIIAVVGLGSHTLSKKSETIDASRLASANAISAIKSLFKKSKSFHSESSPIKVAIDSLNSFQGAAEGATLSSYTFDSYKSAANSEPKVWIEPLGSNDHDLSDWETGIFQGRAQNLARGLMETPANLLTPTQFCTQALDLFSPFSDTTELKIHDLDWIRDHKMGAFLSVSRGSIEPPKFLEIKYFGASDPNQTPLAIVGKGVTFDSGGISIKPSADMAMMKGDMGGAAVTISTVWAMAAMKVKVNCVAVIPLTENMPSGSATKPGDLVYAMNGKSVEVDNTDAEGRLILADAIHYVAKTYKPHSLIELSTLTGAMDIALGSVFTGVFTKSDRLWKGLNEAGVFAGDKFWRMPLDAGYKKQIMSNVADLKNVGGRSGGSCTAAIFLNEFVPTAEELREEKVDESVEEETETTLEESTEDVKTWDAKKNGIMFAHIDIAGVMHNKGADGYIGKGMTGRPTRSIIEFAKKTWAELK